MSARVFVVEDEALIAMGFVDRLQELRVRRVWARASWRSGSRAHPCRRARPDPHGHQPRPRPVRHRGGRAPACLVGRAGAVPHRVLRPELAERAAQTGSFGFLVKPFQPHALRANIEMALALRVADRTVRESEARFRHVIENMSDGVVIDDLAGRIVYCNIRFLEIFRPHPRERGPVPRGLRRARVPAAAPRAPRPPRPGRTGPDRLRVRGSAQRWLSRLGLGGGDPRPRRERPRLRWGRSRSCATSPIASWWYNDVKRDVAMRIAITECAIEIGRRVSA